MSKRGPTPRPWRSPENLLILLAMAMPLAFSTWAALINNFAIDQVSFTGVEMGILQSLREVPGFLTFTVIFLLLLVREQPLALLSLCVLGVGTAITGFFPSIYGLYFTTVLMSIGFHYFEALHQSLALQWLDKHEAPAALGRMLAAGSFAGLLAFTFIYFAIDVFGLAMQWVYVLGGGATVAIALFCWRAFPTYPAKVEQHKTIVVRRKYWLYYALQFMSGARRQIFVVFAGFLMVEKFAFDPGAMALLFLANSVITILFAPLIGRLIGRWGERRALTFEYIGLILVFGGYAFVESSSVAIGLYLLDHLFFALAIAMKTYFQKIADPKDIASTSGVVFTVNHIAAIVLPAAYGFLWMISPTAVFLSGAALAGVSLVLARVVPDKPTPERVAVIGNGYAMRQTEGRGEKQTSAA
jgi:predicted MFS family arabinose efflux permease